MSEKNYIEEISFKACKYLDFSDNYIAQKALISSYGETKICWERKDPEGNFQLCQFCKKRGRMNSPEYCLDEKHKGCSDFEEVEHIIKNPNNKKGVQK